jgi:hypothetical protein
MRRRSYAPAGVLALATAAIVISAAACTGQEAVLVGNTIMAAGAAANPPIMRAVDGIKGWKRTGPPGRYAKDGLYGYIDGGAEIVLSYGFRELSVFRFRSAEDPASSKEIVLEIYRMKSGTSAFGLYSTKLEGDEKGWPKIKSDNWVSPGQANLVKGDYLVNVLAPECTDQEIGPFMAAVDLKLPAYRTVRPEGLDRLPPEGQVPSSGRYIKGPVAARGESPFLEGGFWGFGGPEAGKSATEAFSAKYGTAPAVSKLIVVELGTKVDAGAVDAGVTALFHEYLQGVIQEGDLLEGRNEAGRWFLFRRKAAVAFLVLGEPDRAAAGTRLEKALARALGQLGA